MLFLIITLIVRYLQKAVALKANTLYRPFDGHIKGYFETLFFAILISKCLIRKMFIKKLCVNAKRNLHFPKVFKSDKTSTCT